MLHSPPRTRSQASASAAQAAGTEACPTTMTAVQEATAEAPVLQALLREMQQLRAERAQEREELRELRRRQEQGQGEQGQFHPISSFIKLRPDTFDGSEPFYDYMAQFELIARANAWTEGEKALVFAANLRGQARCVLEGMGENLNFEELKSKLELHFGERFQNYYVLFTNRRIKDGENFASFGYDLERLARFAYPECSFEVRDKIVCAQFVAGLPEGLVKRTLQLEGLVSLRTAVERAKIIQGIFERENLFGKQRQIKEKFNGPRSEELSGQSRPEFYGQTKNFRKDKGQDEWKQRKGKGEGSQSKRNGKECWQCGDTGHFRAECPTWVQRSGN